jgi:hypothetical protein
VKGLPASTRARAITVRERGVDDWVRKILETVLTRALLDAHDNLQDALDGLQAPTELSSSPQVRVVDVSAPSGADPGTANIEIRGEQPLFERTVSPLLRVQVARAGSAG